MQKQFVHNRKKVFRADRFPKNRAAGDAVGVAIGDRLEFTLQRAR